MSSYLDVHVSHQDDSPVQLGCFHVDQIERLAAGQQQEVRLKTKASASARSGTTPRKIRALSAGPLSSITDNPIPLISTHDHLIIPPPPLNPP